MSARQLLVVLTIAALGLVLARVPVAPPADFSHHLPGSRDPQAISGGVSAPSPAMFADTTLDAGLTFVHQQGDEPLAGLDESLGPGACAFDYDNDGWTDLFLVNGTGQTRFYGKPHWWQIAQGNALFRNIAGKRFDDVTVAAGLSAQIWGMGCLTGDFDNDDDTDLLVTGKGRNLLYANDGSGHFTDLTRESGIQSDAWSTSAAAADFNGDGLLDIAVGNFVHFTKGTKTYEADSQFAPERRSTFDASLYGPQPNQLYLNLGRLRFREVAGEAGVQDAEGRTLDVSWTDVNDDGRPDLIVSNDRGTGSNTAYINLDGHRFEPGPTGLRLRSVQGTRGIASGDITGDAEPDLVIASAPGENNLALVKTGVSGNAASARFTDRARETGVGTSAFLSLSSWTPGIHDFNNDGANDIFFTTGLLDPDPDSPRIPQGQPDQLLLNRGDGLFVDGTATAGAALRDRQSARGAVFADFDNDGRMDIYIANNNDPGQLLMNRTPPRHWLGLRLQGKGANRDAIGAGVKVKTADGTLLRLVSSGEGFLSDSDKRLLFGLGETAQILGVEIRWPDGRIQELGPLPIDRYLMINEGKPTVSALPTPADTHQVPPTLPLPAGMDRPELRARYIALLAQFGGLPQVSPALHAAADDTDPQVRRAVIEVVTATQSPKGLTRLIRALDDADTDNVVAAIEGLRQYEDETSVRWLLRLFDHQDAAVRIAVAQCFAYFFAEEEAVVQRKYLAIPYLGRALDDPEPAVRRAAARALAAGERYRGLHSLLAHLTDPDASVRAEVARTLGLIRQRYAIPALRRLLNDGNQPHEVLANILIALKRLDDTELPTASADLVSGRGNHAALPAATRLDVLQDLLGREAESTVFARAELQRLAALAFASTHPGQVTDPLRTDLLLRWIPITAGLGDPSATSRLNELTSDPAPAVRAATFAALLGNLDPAQDALARRARSDPDPVVRRLGAQAMLDGRKPLSADDFRALFSDPDTRTLALNRWTSIGIPQDPIPWEALLPASEAGALEPYQSLEPADAPMPPWDDVSRSGARTPDPAIMGRICLHPDPQIHDYCSLLIFHRSSPESRALASKLLLDTSLTTDFRLQILQRYDAAFDPDAINTLFALAKVKKEPLRPAAVSKLLAMDSASLLEFARTLAQTTSEDPVLRFDAMQYLARYGTAADRDAVFPKM